MRHVAKIISRQHFIIVTNDDKKMLQKIQTCNTFLLLLIILKTVAETL